MTDVVQITVHFTDTPMSLLDKLAWRTKLIPPTRSMKRKAYELYSKGPDEYVVKVSSLRGTSLSDFATEGLESRILSYASAYDTLRDYEEWETVEGADCTSRKDVSCLRYALVMKGSNPFKSSSRIFKELRLSSRVPVANCNGQMKLFAPLSESLQRLCKSGCCPIINRKDDVVHFKVFTGKFMTAAAAGVEIDSRFDPTNYVDAFAHIDTSEIKVQTYLNSSMKEPVERALRDVLGLDAWDSVKTRYIKVSLKRNASHMRPSRRRNGQLKLNRAVFDDLVMNDPVISSIFRLQDNRVVSRSSTKRTKKYDLLMYGEKKGSCLDVSSGIRRTVSDRDLKISKLSSDIVSGDKVRALYNGSWHDAKVIKRVDKLRFQIEYADGCLGAQNSVDALDRPGLCLSFARNDVGEIDVTFNATNARVIKYRVRLALSVLEYYYDQYSRVKNMYDSIINDLVEPHRLPVSVFDTLIGDRRESLSPTVPFNDRIVDVRNKMKKHLQCARQQMWNSTTDHLSSVLDDVNVKLDPLLWAPVVEKVYGVNIMLVYEIDGLKAPLSKNGLYSDREKDYDKTVVLFIRQCQTPTSPPVGTINIISPKVFASKVMLPTKRLEDDGKAAYMPAHLERLTNKLVRHGVIENVTTTAGKKRSIVTGEGPNALLNAVHVAVNKKHRKKNDVFVFDSNNVNDMTLLKPLLDEYKVITEFIRYGSPVVSNFQCIDGLDIAHQRVDKSGKCRAIGLRIGSEKDVIVDVFIPPRAPLDDVTTRTAVRTSKLKKVPSSMIEWMVSEYDGRIEGSDILRLTVCNEQCAAFIDREDRLKTFDRNKQRADLYCQICLYYFSKFMCEENSKVYEFRRDGTRFKLPAGTNLMNGTTVIMDNAKFVICDIASRPDAVLISLCNAANGAVIPAPVSGTFTSCEKMTIDDGKVFINRFFAQRVVERESAKDYRFKEALADNFAGTKIAIPLQTTEALKYFITKLLVDPLYILSFKECTYLENFYSSGPIYSGDNEDTIDIKSTQIDQWALSQITPHELFTRPRQDIQGVYMLQCDDLDVRNARNFTEYSKALRIAGPDPQYATFSDDKFSYDSTPVDPERSLIIGMNTAAGPVYTVAFPLNTEQMHIEEQVVNQINEQIDAEEELDRIIDDIDAEEREPVVEEPVEEPVVEGKNPEPDMPVRRQAPDSPVGRPSRRAFEDLDDEQVTAILRRYAEPRRSQIEDLTDEQIASMLQSETKNAEKDAVETEQNLLGMLEDMK